MTVNHLALFSFLTLGVLSTSSGAAAAVSRGAITPAASDPVILADDPDGPGIVGRSAVVNRTISETGIAPRPAGAPSVIDSRAIPTPGGAAGRGALSNASSVKSAATSAGPASTPSRTTITPGAIAVPSSPPQSAGIGRAAMSSSSAARSAATSSSTVSRARAGESARELGTPADIGNRATDANTKGIVNENSAVRRAGIALRPTTAEVGGRATIVGTDTMTGSNVNDARAAVPRTARAATDNAVVAPRGAGAVNADSLAAWEATNSVNETCRQQYAECMDQFCNVIDATQNRCSCSASLTSYTQIEKTVKSANDQLNEVAQRIRYVGLSADEIRAIMSATEAELELAGAKDKTESRKMLDQIESLIRDPNAFAEQNSTNGIMDLDLDFTEDLDFSDWFDINFGSGSSFSNKRGSQLLSAAKNKCAPVLNACKSNGADINQVTSHYDLLVEKDCLTYEKGLDKMNSTLKTNVRAATTMLQKARLAVLQDQNLYDTRGCLGALETCMTDEMVCGPDYYKCVDPTKKYIDENGDVVLGRNVTSIEAFIKNYSNADPDLGKAMGLFGYSTCETDLNSDGTCIIKYLLEKIGTGDTTSGLCRPVLDKCRRVTYKGGRGNTTTYDPTNEVIKNYIQRTMTIISAAQRKIISDYAMGCMSDISTCYSQQVAQISAWSSNANLDIVYRVMKGACRNVALTCSYAVFAADIAACPKSGGENTCIESISDVFYQSLLCPLNSVYVSPTLGGYVQPYDPAERVSERCYCENGFKIQSGLCVKK